jgi:hypothetical protein
MQGTFDFEFIGNFFNQFFTLWKVAIFRQIRKPLDFKPDRSRRRKEAHSNSEKSEPPCVGGYNRTGIFFSARNFFTSPTV